MQRALCKKRAAAAAHWGEWVRCGGPENDLAGEVGEIVALR